LRLIQVREKDWPAGRRDAFAARLRDLAQTYGATLLLNGDEAAARALRLHGVHWPAAMLHAAQRRPRDLLVAASCHDRRDLDRAAALNVDFCVLGPVNATPTHPQATPLGFARFAELVEGTQIPVYALGGLVRSDLRQAIDRGAHGVALRRHAWPAS
jgi:8-oxo-dGTP diphosphatase